MYFFFFFFKDTGNLFKSRSSSTGRLEVERGWSRGRPQSMCRDEGRALVLAWGEQGAGGMLPTPPLSLPRARYTPITHSTAFTAPPARSPPRHQAWDNTPGPKQPLPSSGAMRPGLGSWGGWPGPEGTHLGVQGAAGEGSCARSPSFAAREGTGGVGTP